VAKVNMIEQLKNDLTGLGTVAGYNAIKNTVAKVVPDSVPFKDLIVPLASYLFIVYKGLDFIPVSGYDAVRIEALADVVIQGMEEIPYLKAFAPMLGGFVEGMEDEYIEGIDDENVYTIDSDNNNNTNYVEGTGIILGK